MSRCFPYPPPGYALSSESLIESIKLQKGKKKPREQRKKEKRREKQEKKEKRKEKKDQINQKLDKSRIVKSRNDEKVWADKKDEFLSKGREAEIEQIENSSLSEEHRRPLCLDVPSSSSDGTENSHKRKRHSSQLDGTRGHCKITRVQLPSNKKNKPDAPANKLRLCIKSGTTVFRANNKDDDGLRDGRENVHCTLEGSSNLIRHHFSRKTDEEQISSTSRPVEAVAPGKTGIPSIPNAAMTSLHRAAALGYNFLIENWSPPQQHIACFAPDLDWLFQGRNPNEHAEKRRISGNSSMSCSSSSAMWPRAQYLNDVEIYASPFTVPF